MHINGDINTLSSLNVDSDGNGVIDIVLGPIVGGVVTYTEPIVSEVVPSGGNGPIIFGTSTIPIINFVPITDTTTTPVLFELLVPTTTQLSIPTTTSVGVFPKVITKKQIVKKPTQDSVENPLQVNQTAFVVYSKPGYLPRLWSGIKNLIRKTVDWSLLIVQ
jgi:hypothetical protein